MNNNKKEVGFTPDDNNDRRLPGSVNNEPTRGNAEYGTYKYGKATSLDAGDTGGVVGQPTLTIDGTGLNGTYAPNTNANVDVHNSDTTLMAPVGDSEVNLAAKYKYPNVKQDVPPLGRPSTTYSDHT